MGSSLNWIVRCKERNLNAPVVKKSVDLFPPRHFSAHFLHLRNSRDHLLNSFRPARLKDGHEGSGGCDAAGGTGRDGMAVGSGCIYL